MQIIAVSVLFFGLSASLSPNQPTGEDKANLLVYKDDHGHNAPVTNEREWKMRHDHILENMQLVMGPMPSERNCVPLDMKVTEEVKLPKFVRKKITFAVEAGDRVPAYLFIPTNLAGKAPAMLCLHQTTSIGKAEPAGLGGKANLCYALELAERGYVTLAPDYPGFGDYKIDPYAMGYDSATMKGIWNHKRAVDLLQSLPDVDPERIGAIGHSLGGHNTLFVGAFDPRLKVLVSSCGFCSFATYYGGDLTGWSHKGYMPKIAQIYNKDPRKMPFDFTEVLAVLAPRPVFINAPEHDANFSMKGVDECVDAARPVYALFHAADNLVVAHPDSEHDFPPEVRQTAYAFIDRVLKPK